VFVSGRVFGVEFMSATHHGSPSKVLDGKLHVQVPSDAIILFSRTATSRIADISIVSKLLVALKSFSHFMRRKLLGFRVLVCFPRTAKKRS
jgi:hypothetical protein